ncbi:MAG: zinc-dependent metalloprotease [Saprospiraceae bacterium]|nr:zinc-dependent metalloprotease [Saprospiraceae bacterium]
MYKHLFLFCLLALFACKTTKPTTQTTPPTQQSPTPTQAAVDKKPEEKKPASKGKSYKDVITKDAKTDEGLFKVHLLDEKVFYEIPNSLLDVDMLLISRIAGCPANLSPFLNAGSSVNEQVVQWQRKGNKILLRAISYSNVADEELPISLSVKYNNFEPIIDAFKIETMSDDSSAIVIDVTSLFTTDINAISGLSSALRTQYRVTRLDAERSFIDTVRSYPINVEVVHTQTFVASAPPSNQSTGTITIQMNQSMIRLPEQPMMSRLYDERVGWFTVSQYNYGSEELKSDQVRYIRRWRLEPKDPVAYARGELVEPVKPIVYYLDPATPAKWRPNRYMLETGAANPSARTLQTPEEEIGEMMRRVISHEIGHALGLPHNMKASSAYPVDSLRSGTFTQKYGIATTIMDYARYNYIAQPGDKNIRFVRQMGPYDSYAINWGYRVIPNAKSSQDEKPTLDKWIKAKEGDPMYMFGSGGGGYDPNAQTENIGDDAVKASTYGLANLKKVAPNLIEWTNTDGKNYEDLDELYDELVGVWNRYIGHVVTNVGGVYQTLKTSDQQGVVYNSVSRTKQQETVKWLLDNAFATPNWLMDAEISRRIEPTGMVERIRALQARHLAALLNASRLQRMIETQAMEGSKAYSMFEMCTDLRQGIWSELYAAKPTEVTRRNLQRAYLESMSALLIEGTPSPGATFDLSQSDVQAVVRAELKALQNDIRRNMARVKDSMTRYHLQDCLDRIEKTLDPKG